MNITDLCDTSLIDLHKLIKEALKTDDDCLKNQPKRYGVREYPDWKTQCDAYEAELRKRKLDFSPIKW